MASNYLDSTATVYTKPDPLSPVSYNTIRNLLPQWRGSGSNNSQFDELDTPGHLFFKIVFHFYNGDIYGAEPGAMHNGLLHPSWIQYGNEASIASQSSKIGGETQAVIDNQCAGDSHPSSGYSGYDNSAYNFLLRNDELERAELLKQFIILLSNISTYSPWYFMEISGLEALLERPRNPEEDFKIEAPKSFTIKCLPDAQDNRVATLIDLYREIVYSYELRHEILPANLRKFDMSIYIFDSMIKPLHFGGDGAANMALRNSMTPSYKCIELHGCEFDYNGSKDGYSGLNNAEGFVQTFSLPIKVDDAYENRYNAYIDRQIGDMVAVDLARQIYTDRHFGKIISDKAQESSDMVLKSLSNRLNYYKGRIDVLGAVDNATGNKISMATANVLLGNIYKTSISDITRNTKAFANSVMSGNIRGAAAAVNNLSGSKNSTDEAKSDLSNIFGMTEVKNGWYTTNVKKTNIFTK